jgi:hypothetical protein
MTTWISSQHAADTTAQIVARTGSPVSPQVLDAAESVADTITSAGLPLGTPKAFASTVLAAMRATEAGRLR